MAASAGRRLRPLAVVCALLMVAWGAASIASLVVQIMNYDEFGWPDENADGEIWAYVVLYLAAAASGAWVAVWGLFGLAWRPPLHLGAVALLVAIGVEVTANVVQVSYFSDLGAPVNLGDQAEGYVDRITFDTGVAVSEGRAFLTALPLMTAFLPLLAWLVVLVSGAGRKRRFAPQYGQPQYGQPQYGQPQYGHPQYGQPQYAAPYGQVYPHQPAYQPQHAHPPPQHYPPQPPAYRLPQEPAYQAPPDPPRHKWGAVPPVLPERPAAVRPTPPPQQPPDQETLPYQKPTQGP
ncbi:hypothetical protein [Nocardioides immobilis]|uniref:hypothetical protein n=1 Tax=Nocardioides immobilis TaxID=2049295 RepID=UPI001FEBDD38|nr:hypothetical protein [Nocardioides immobilis]